MRRLVPAGFLVLASACVSGESSGPAFSVVDSAGVHIADNQMPTGDEVAGWRVPEEPTLVIGSPSGPPESQLYRVQGAEVLSDGRIAILNAGTSEVRLFTSSGDFIRAIGSRGEGPGEFDRLGGLVVTPGDTLLAWNGGADARATFSSDGALIEHREFHGDVIPRFLNDGAPLAGGGFVFLIYDREQEASDVPSRSRQWLARVGRRVDRLDTLGAWPGVLTKSVEVGSSSPMFGSSRNVTALFSPTTEMAVGGRPERIVVGDSRTSRLHVFDAEGEQVMQIRWNASRRRPSPDDIEAALAADLERRPEAERSARTDALRSMLPDSLPAFDELVVDQTGHIWARRYLLPRDLVAEWDVFRPDGRWSGVVELPPDLRLLDAGEAYVLGVRQDELDVEMVVRYPLLKDSSTVPQ